MSGEPRFVDVLGVSRERGVEPLALPGDAEASILTSVVAHPHADVVLAGTASGKCWLWR